MEAVKKIATEKKDSLENLTEQDISDNVWTAGQPDPDIVVRTSGEMRLSGFLTWQSVYSELIFVNSHWPEFSEKDLDDVIGEYNRRNRRFGGN